LLAILAAALGFWFTPASSLSADNDWVSLFNGKDLDGWVQRGGKAKYRVEDGQVVGSSVPGTANSFLCTKKNYANFILELEFKVDHSLNSWVQIRSKCFNQPKTVELNGEKSNIPADRVHGYQVEIDHDDTTWTRGIYEE